MYFLSIVSVDVFRVAIHLEYLKKYRKFDTGEGKSMKLGKVSEIVVCVLCVAAVVAADSHNINKKTTRVLLSISKVYYCHCSCNSWKEYNISFMCS